MPDTALTAQNLVKWLRQQRPEEEYIWQDPTFCLVGRFLHDHNSCWGTVAYSDLPNYEAIAQPKPWTFGAALARAERLALPAPQMTPVKQIEGELVASQAVTEGVTAP